MTPPSRAQIIAYRERVAARRNTHVHTQAAVMSLLNGTSSWSLPHTASGVAGLELWQEHWRQCFHTDHAVTLEVYT